MSENIAVELFQVGGQIRLVDLTPYVVSGSWENALDAAPGVSTAQVTLQAGISFEELPILKKIHPWYHELRISLDGNIVFEGPVRYYSGPIAKGAQIVADDISSWFGVRFIHDVFDWSTGEEIGVIIEALVNSAIVGGPQWADADNVNTAFKNIPDVNIIPYLNVQPITEVIQQQNGTIPAGLDQGELAVHEPFERLWDEYLNVLVGSRVHMSCQGRAVNFWSFGTALSKLNPVSMADFTAFPNITRTGDRFATFVAIRAKNTELSLLHDGAAGDTTFALGSGPWREAGFYVGQLIQSGTGLQLAIGTLIGARHGFYPLSSIDLALSVEPDGLGGWLYPAQLLSTMPTGTSISGNVTGQAGGVHPEWPVLVERVFSRPNVIWKVTADSAAEAEVQLLAPFDSLDENEFKPIVGRYLPWDFVKLVPGQGTMIDTPLGSIPLQISHVGGQWDGNGKLTLHVGLQTMVSEQSTIVDYPAWQGNQFTPNPEVDLTLGLNITPAMRRRRRRMATGAVTGPYYNVTSAGKPDALFFPDAALFIKLVKPSDRDVLQIGLGTAAGSIDVSNAQYDVIVVSCLNGSQ